MNQQQLNHLFLCLNNAKRDKEYYEKEIRILIIDKDLDLDARWNLFCEFCKLYKTAHDIYYLHIKNKAISNKFDGAFENRYETMYVTEMLFSMKHDSSISENDVNEFKEQCMEEFVFSFTYDW
jgi:hypothetical protein